MLFEQGASDHAAASNLAYMKATAKMINLLKQDEELKNKMKGKIKGGTL